MTDDGLASLLRQHRRRLGLTQEALAERAGVSARSIRDIERGGRVPRRHTVGLLAAALELADEHRTTFVAATEAIARRRTAPLNPLRASTGPATAGPVPRQLPMDVSDFVGRDEVLREILRALRPDEPSPRLVVISGPAGIGKSALAVQTAHRLASSYPDGQLYVSLHGTTGQPLDPSDALAHLLRSLGRPDGAIPGDAGARAALMRELVVDRRLLLVLDDAAGHEQVAPLLPAGSSAVLVTGRPPLTGLPGSTAVDLMPMGDAAALELFTRIAGRSRVEADPGSVAEVVRACGGLPLAVRIAAARFAAHPQWTARLLADRLGDERRRLAELRHGDLAVRTSLQLGYQALSAPAARSMALLGSLPVATFPEWAAAALLDVPAATGAGMLRELLDARLLDEVGVDPAGQLRYRFHDLTRLFARECQDAHDADGESRAAVIMRAATIWLGIARQVREALQGQRLYLDDPRIAAALGDDRVVHAARQRPVDWFEAERETLGSLVLACADAGGHGIAGALTGTMADFCELRGHYTDWHRMSSAVLAACRRSGDGPGEIAMLRSLGFAQLELDDLDGALEQLRAARTLARQLGAYPSAAMAAKEIGYVLGLVGRLDEAEGMLRAAEEELDRIGRQDTRALALTNLSFVLRQRGELDESVEIARVAQALGEAQRSRFVQAYAGRGLAGALLAAGRGDEAAGAAQRAAELYREIGDPIGEGQSLRALGEAFARDPARQVEAERLLRNAADLFREHPYPWGLALTELSLGELLARSDAPEAADVLRSSLRFWAAEAVPALQARALVALAGAEERRGRDARGLWEQALGHYSTIGSPAAAALADRLSRAGRVGLDD
ncbi:helix-turn-helix domain-containing protein [Plantactinospora siamensis]|uniref:Helix-turn-helix domain-containing protein n=1 Tax=Plantactinospora siamensis TaxID=555372 RepID=A0ABV6NVX4_9ACTN